MINPETVLLLRSDSSGAFGLTLVLLTGLWLAPVQRAASAPELSVAALLALCERGDRQGGVGVDAAFCDWYLLPCDCKLGPAREPQRWCVPDPSTQPLAYAEARERVLAELERLPARGQPATEAVARILQRYYPCAPD